MYGWQSSCYSFHAHFWFSLYRLWWSICSWQRRGKVNHRQETIRFTSAMINFIGIRRRHFTTASDGSWWSWTIQSISFSTSCLVNVSVEIWRDCSFVIKKPLSCFQQFRCTFLTVYCDINQKMITCLNLFVFSSVKIIWLKPVQMGAFDMPGRVWAYTWRVQANELGEKSDRLERNQVNMRKIHHYYFALAVGKRL